jgi:hypothetical protein
MMSKQPVPSGIHVLSADAVDAIASRRLLAWLLEQGADEFTLDVMAIEGIDAPLADAFEDALAPWALPLARRRVVYRWTDTDGTREVRRWRLTPLSLALVEEYLDEGVFSYDVRERGWFEDPAIYRGEALLLAVITHEREGYIRLAPPEAAALIALGVPVGERAPAMSF